MRQAEQSTAERCPWRAISKVSCLDGGSSSTGLWLDPSAGHCWSPCCHEIHHNNPQSSRIEPRDLNSKQLEPGMLVYLCNPSTWEAEAGISGALDHCGLHSKPLSRRREPIQGAPGDAGTECSGRESCWLTTQLPGYRHVGP